MCVATRSHLNGKRLHLGPIKPDTNGQAYVLQEGAKQLAHYPHVREANGFIYVSGLSSRYVGVFSDTHS